MAESISIKNSKGNLTCSVCQSQFNEMVLSSCFHSFCSQCLRIQANKSGNGRTYACPLCSAEVALPDSFNGNSKHLFEDWNNMADLNVQNSFCDICVDRKLAVNRCLQCEESFCEDCTNAHLRMKSSRYHGQRVVPIRGQGHSERHEDLTENSKCCPRHRNEEIIVVCKQCDVLLCIVCKLMEHKDHVTKHIAEDAGGIRQKLSTLLQRNVGYSENIQMQIRAMENKKTQYPKELDQEIGKVRFQATKLHSAIEKETSDMERELITHYGEYTMKSARMGEYLKQDYDDYVALSREAQRLVDSDNDAFVVKNGHVVYDRLKELDSENSTMSEAEQGRPDKKFQAGDIDDRQMSTLIGRISLDKTGKVVRVMSAHDSGTVSNPTSQRKAQTINDRIASASTISSNRSFGSPYAQPLNEIWLPFSDSIGYVYGIAPAGDQQVWVTMLDHTYILLVDQNGTVKLRVDIDEACEGVASDGEGGCFVTCPQNKSIKRVQRNGEVTTIVDNLLQDPHGIASLVHYDQQQFTLLQELYVCCTEPKGLDLMGVNMNSQSIHGCVCGLSFSGLELGISFPVRSPVRVAASPDTMMLATVDHSNGCVMVSDKTGQFVQALYTGADNGGDFQPLGVCFDGSGRVLFADWQGGKVCQMSYDGEWVNELITDLDGPQSVAVSDGNLLWVGTKLGKMYVYKLN